MKTILNFGDPHKNFKPIADRILKNYEIENIPITNCKMYHNKNYQIIEASYGRAMTLDTLSMLNIMNKIKANDKILFLGSMGSLTERLKLDELVIPTEVRCYCLNEKYKNFLNKGIIKPDTQLLEKTLSTIPHAKKYIHGSVLGVFDPTTNHQTYNNLLYEEDVEGLDCTEAFTALEFCKQNNMRGSILLYCSDNPTNHIGDISKKEFDKRALKLDLEMHKYAIEIFKEK